MPRKNEAWLAVRTQAHQNYQNALKDVLGTRGFTQTTIGELQEANSYPALNMEAPDALNSIRIPGGWRRILTQIYPSAPLFISRIALFADSVFMAVQPQANYPDVNWPAISYPEKDGVIPKLDPWILVDWPKGEMSHFRYGTGEPRRRTNKVLTAKEMIELSAFPSLVDAAPIVYPSAHKLAVVDRAMD